MTQNYKEVLWFTLQMVEPL